MSNWIKTSQPCSHCGSSRGFAYKEDHEVCFSCGYRAYTKEKVFKNLTLSKNNESRTLTTAFSGKIIPENFRKWIFTYIPDITDHETFFTVSYCKELGSIYYEPAMNRLIFPYGHYNNNIDNVYYKSWIGRSLDREPKWLINKYTSIYGNRCPYLEFSFNKKPIVIVEDLISAIKIAKYSNVYCVMGTSISNKLINWLLNKSNKFIIWLDNDRAGKIGTDKLLNRLRLVSDVRAINTEFDPKCYSYKIIEELLR